MVITIQRNTLLDSLSKASHIIDPKSFNPSLLGVYLSVDDNGLTIISSKGEQSLKAYIPANDAILEIKQPGKVLIKAKYFLEILRRLEDFKITITSVDTNQLRISGANAEFNLNTMDEEEYPLLGFFEKGSQLVVDAENLKQALNQTSISVNEYNKKLVLSGLNFKVNNNTLVISGTDGVRLSSKVINLDSRVGDEFSINIPLKSIQEVIRLIEGSGDVKINYGEERVTFTVGNCIFQSTLLVGQFPDISSAFPKDFNSVIILGNREFTKVVQRAEVGNEEVNATVVNFTLANKKILVTSTLSEIGNFEEEFTEFDLEGQPEQMLAFNAKFFLDAVRTFNTKVIKLKIIGNKSPIVITSDEDPELIQMVLPMLMS